MLVVLVGADDVADGVAALAVALFRLGPAAPEAGPIENHLRAVVAQEGVVARHPPVLHDGVGDVGGDVNLDVAGPDAHQLLGVAEVGNPGRRHFVARLGALPRELRAGVAVAGRLAARAGQAVVAVHEHVAGQRREDVDKIGQDEDLRVPEDVAAIAVAAERLGPDADAVVVLRRGHQQLEQVEAHGQLSLVVALNHHVAVAPDAGPGGDVGGAQAVVGRAVHFGQGAGHNAGRLARCRRVPGRWVAVGGDGHQLVGLQRLTGLQVGRGQQGGLAGAQVGGALGAVVGRGLGAEGRGHGQGALGVARAGAQPDGVAALALLFQVQVQQVLVGHVAVDGGADDHGAGVRDGRHQQANGGHVPARVGDEALEVQVDRLAVGGLPQHGAAQHPGAQVGVALEVEHAPLVEAEVVAVDGDGQSQPVGQVNQLGEDDGHVVPHAVGQGQGRLAGVALLERAAGGERAIAQGEDRLHVVLRGRVEAALDDVPAGVEGDGGGQFVEGHVAQVVATGDAAIGRQPAEAVGWAEGQRGHPGGQRGLDAGGGVFDHQTVGSSHAQAGGGEAEQVGVGLLALDAVAVGQRRQSSGDAQPLADGAGVLAGRGQGVGDAGGVEGVEQAGHAR